MLVQRIIEQVEKGCKSEVAEHLKAHPEYGPTPPHGWRVYRSHIGAYTDEVVFEVEFESWAEREAWWKSWSGSTPRQKEWHAKRRELVARTREEIWDMDKYG